jgi:type II secretory pathway pseudopilin PulG
MILNNILENMIKMNIYTVLLIICGLGVLILPFFVANEEKKIATEENKKSQDDLKEKIREEASKNQTLILANQDLIEKNNKLSEIIFENTQKLEEISNVVYKNTQQITGNGSYPFATWTGGGFGKDRQIIVHLVGEFALPNLEAHVTVIDDYSTVNGTDMRVLGIFSPTISLGTLRKTESKSFNVEAKTNETSIIIRFKSDNHSWGETILLKGNKKLWIIKDEKGNTLEKHIDKGFPVNKKGEIVIWSNVSTMPNGL